MISLWSNSFIVLVKSHYVYCRKYSRTLKVKNYNKNIVKCSNTTIFVAFFSKPKYNIKNSLLAVATKLNWKFHGKHKYLKADVLLKENIWLKDIYEETKRKIPQYNNGEWSKWIVLDFSQYIFANYIQSKIK